MRTRGLHITYDGFKGDLLPINLQRTGAAVLACPASTAFSLAQRTTNQRRRRICELSAFYIKPS